ncbi:H/ACA snoRNP pseudouridylase subunit [Mitosporidium daphniae]
MAFDRPRGRSSYSGGGANRQGSYRSDDFGPPAEILGMCFTIKPSEGILATSFKPTQKIFIGTDKLLPLERFLPKPKSATPSIGSKRKAPGAGGSARGGAARGRGGGSGFRGGSGGLSRL